MVRDFNLYPLTEWLITLERKYGDGITFEDLNGYRKRKAKKAQFDATASGGLPAATEYASQTNQSGSQLEDRT